MKSAIMLLAALSMAAPARAAVTAEDVQVAGRVLAFTATPLSGNVRLGIVYDPGNAASAADERALLGILGSGMQVGAVNLVPVPIPLGKLANTPADVLFLTAGLGASAAAARTAADAQQIMCITTDLAATQAGTCAVAVQSEPKVSITVNKAAAAAANVSFGTAFMLMITQI
jgi:hypothetical protein